MESAVSGLGARHAVLFMPMSGDWAGHAYPIVDMNGATSYQAGANHVFEFVGATQLLLLGTGNFI